MLTISCGHHLQYLGNRCGIDLGRLHKFRSPGEIVLINCIKKFIDLVDRGELFQNQSTVPVVSIHSRLRQRGGVGDAMISRPGNVLQ